MPGMPSTVKRRNLPAAEPVIVAPRKETPPSTDAEETGSSSTADSVQQTADELRKLLASPLNAVSHMQAQQLVNAVKKQLRLIQKAEHAAVELALGAENLLRQFAVYTGSPDYSRDQEWNELRDTIDDFVKSADEMLDAVDDLTATDRQK